MSAMSDYLEQGLLNWLLRGQAAPTLAADVYFALFTAAPSDSGGGTEVTGGSYARKAITRATGAFDAPSGGATSNTGAITFVAPSGANWGTVTHWGMFDASSGGNLLLHGALTNSKVINDGDAAPSWPIGAFDVTLTGVWSAYLRDAFINWLFRAVALPTLPANVYASLHTGAPGTTGANEVSGGAYARVAISRATGSWAAPGVGGATDNVSPITFPAPSGANWGLVTDAGLFDASSAGNFLLYSTQADKNVNDGDAAPSIAAGAFDVVAA